jgi:hypothetical protein
VNALNHDAGETSAVRQDSDGHHHLADVIGALELGVR